MNVEVEGSTLIPSLSHLRWVWSTRLGKAKVIEHSILVGCKTYVFPFQSNTNLTRWKNQLDIMNVEVEGSTLIPSLSHLRWVWSARLGKAKAIEHSAWCKTMFSHSSPTQT